MRSSGSGAGSDVTLIEGRKAANSCSAYHGCMPAAIDSTAIEFRGGRPTGFRHGLAIVAINPIMVVAGRPLAR